MSCASLTMTQTHHAQLRAHLFPGDGLEAVALLLCGRRRGNRHRLLVREILLVPHDDCDRAVDRVTWHTDIMLPLLERAERRGQAVLKIHGHGELRAFSAIDDTSDRALFSSLKGWLGDEPLGSLVMMEDGELIGRIYKWDGGFEPMERIAVVGDDLQLWFEGNGGTAIPTFGARVAQSFGKGTFEQLRKLKVGVVGCSGTGSPVIEMLARNCVGELVLVDPDEVEERNLNRILNTTMTDALAARYKVEVIGAAVKAIGLGTKVQAFSRSLFDREVVHALADCDVLFGCMDSIDGRHLLNRLATFYLIPYFDLGVKGTSKNTIFDRFPDL